MEVKSAPRTTRAATSYDVTDDVFGIRTLFVNVFFVGEPGEGNPWVLVDTGLPGYAGTIRDEAEKLYGTDNPPRAIVLTHGHIDHAGSLKTLLDTWTEVPVYAHRLELPYLTGQSSYPPPDPGIGGGAIAYLSWMLPFGSIDVSGRVKAIEGDQIPELSGWRVLHTPGHSPGHISLFRDGDRTLLAGDAFSTTNMNALTAVATQKMKVHGPPAFLTINWEHAEQSVDMLAKLNPLAVGAGHGIAIRGLDVALELNRLVHDFRERSIPSRGRYVKEPAIADETGIISMPTPVSYQVGRALGLGVLVGFGLYLALRNRH